MMRVAVAALLMLLMAAPVAAQAPGPPPPPGPGVKTKPLTPQTDADKAKIVAMTCKIKANWSFTTKKVGGAVVDSVSTVTKGETRYCMSQRDFLLCKTHNPTPDIPCKLISPMLPLGSSCLPATTTKVTQDKVVSGLWDVLDKQQTITLDTFTCDRAYKMDSCRYHHENTAITSFKNAGIASVDRRITGWIAACRLDEAAEAAYQKKLAKGVLDLNALLQIKRGLWNARCKSNVICRAKAAQLAKQAETEAWEQLPINHDGDGIATMKTISAKYDPIAAKELN
jgi:hypothetical protein